MKGYRFYLEYDSSVAKNKATVKEPGNHMGNVLALIVGTNDVIGALSYERNAEVCSTSASNGYLRSRCKRIPEKLAREIHPRLFNSGLL